MGEVLTMVGIITGREGKRGCGKQAAPGVRAVQVRRGGSLRGDP